MSRSTHLSQLELFRLNLACAPISQAFDGPPYLVGSVLKTRDWRDVDVRLILSDEHYDSFITSVEIATMLDMAFSAYLRDATGLPIDFQIQRQTEANAAHNGMRNPLGLRSLGNFRGDGRKNSLR